MTHSTSESSPSEPAVPSSIEYKQRIRWTAEEYDKLASVLADLRMKDPIPAIQSMVAKAQELALPTERRRMSLQIGNCPELAIRVMEKLDKIRAHSRAYENSEPRIVPQEVIVEVPIRDIAEFETYELYLELGNRLNEEKPSKVEEPEADVPVSFPHRDKALRVGITSLMPHQKEFIENRLKHAPVEIVVIGSTNGADGRSATTLTSTPLLDHAIVTKWSRHTMYYSVKAHYQSTFLCHGGLSSLVTLVTDLLNKPQ